MLSKKSFLADEQNFSAPLVGPMLGQREGPHRIAAKRSQIFVQALQRLAATEPTKTIIGLYWN